MLPELSLQIPRETRWFRRVKYILILLIIYLNMHPGVPIKLYACHPLRHSHNSIFKLFCYNVSTFKYSLFLQTSKICIRLLVDIVDLADI